MVFGCWGHWVVECFLVLTQFGYCVGYTIYLCKALSQMSSGHLSETQVVLLLSPIFVVLCCVKGSTPSLPIPRFDPAVV